MRMHTHRTPTACACHGQGVRATPKINNPRYRQFIETGLIELLEKEEFDLTLTTIQHEQKDQARALVIMLYWSGRRPSEVLELRGRDIVKEAGGGSNQFKVSFTTRKRGVHSILYFTMLNPQLKEFFEYSKTVFPDVYLFWAFRSQNTKLVKWNRKDGTPMQKQKASPANKLYYWFNKWFQNNPYYFRHNRLSIMAQQGATLYELAHQKGARDLKSVEAYRHMSKDEAKKLVKYQK